MSKIGSQPIAVPPGVTVTADDRTLTVKGARGELTVKILPGVRVALEGNTLSFSVEGTSKQVRSNWGTVRALAANAVQGVTGGFSKTLILEGVGYRIVKEGNDLTLSLGFSHPVRYTAPSGVALEVEKNTILTVRGADRALVGQVAAEIRALKKPEPYKGKGFHYADEVVKRKAGKKATATTGAAA